MGASGPMIDTVRLSEMLTKVGESATCHIILNIRNRKIEICCLLDY